MTHHSPGAPGRRYAEFREAYDVDTALQQRVADRNALDIEVVFVYEGAPRGGARPLSFCVVSSLCCRDCCARLAARA